jgi:hypothetical protein
MSTTTSPIRIEVDGEVYPGAEFRVTLNDVPDNRTRLRKFADWLFRCPPYNEALYVAQQSDGPFMVAFMLSKKINDIFRRQKYDAVADWDNGIISIYKGAA